MAYNDDRTMEKPGDVIIDSIILKSYNGFEMDIRGLFVSITLHEDIFANYMTGSILIMDSLNLAKNFPVIGCETISIKYRTPNYEDGGDDHQLVSLNFRTYKVSVYSEMQQESGTILRLEFMSEQGIKSLQTKVSRAYPNMTISDMVISIFDDYLASDNSDQSNMNSGSGLSPFPKGSTIPENVIAKDYAYVSRNNKIPMRRVIPTFDIRSYVIPYWTPLYTINWLCHRSRNILDPTICDYVFFENSGGFHFAPITTLKQSHKLSGGKHHTYTNYPPGFRSENSERMIVSEMRNVLGTKMQDYSDRAKQQVLGMFGSSMWTHDMTTKRWVCDVFSYDDAFDKNKAIESYPLIPKDKNNYSSANHSHIKFYPNSSFISGNSISNHDPNEIILTRQSMVNQINSINLVIDAWGDSNVKVGDTIKYVPITKEFNRKNDKWEDDYLKGFYLVTAIKHVITDKEHTMTMTVSRDSHGEPFADAKKMKLQLEGS